MGTEVQHISLLLCLLCFGLGTLQARPASAAAIEVPGSTQPADILTAWITCKGHLLKTGDVGGAVSGKAAVPFMTGATRIRITARVLQPQKGYSVAGFSVYRTWASPHWLQVESYASATLCRGPWTASVDGRGAAYTPGDLGPRVVPGRYYLALLWRRTGNPMHLLSAELSNRPFQLPLRGGPSIVLWGCTGPALAGTCHSPLFRTF